MVNHEARMSINGLERSTKYDVLKGTEDNLRVRTPSRHVREWRPFILKKGGGGGGGGWGRKVRNPVWTAQVTIKL